MQDFDKWAALWEQHDATFDKIVVLLAKSLGYREFDKRDIATQARLRHEARHFMDDCDEETFAKDVVPQTPLQELLVAYGATNVQAPIPMHGGYEHEARFINALGHAPSITNGHLGRQTEVLSCMYYLLLYYLLVGLSGIVAVAVLFVLSGRSKYKSNAGAPLTAGLNILLTLLLLFLE